VIASVLYFCQIFWMQFTYRMKILKVASLSYSVNGMLQEFFQRQRQAAERNEVTLRRDQTQRTKSSRISQDLIGLQAYKHSVQPPKGPHYCLLW